MNKMNDFLMSWDAKYKNDIENIDLFKIEKTKYLTNEQKIYFAKVFYHARGHFHNFLWYLGNHATDKSTKDIVIKNISEELNGSAQSHEQLYINFGNAIGADIKKEAVEQSNYLPFIREFNNGHIEWLNSHSEEVRFAAFSAYERLDNIDYIYLDRFVESIDVSKKHRLFFTVNLRVEHFESTEGKLNTIWNQDSNHLHTGFEFIASHQINMWKKLSNVIFNYG